MYIERGFTGGDLGCECFQIWILGIAEEEKCGYMLQDPALPLGTVSDFVMLMCQLEEWNPGSVSDALL